MSKIGYKLIEVPQGVTVLISGQDVTVKGPHGDLSYVLPKQLSIEQTEGKLSLTRTNNTGYQRSLHGLYRSLIANAVSGTRTLWTKRLEVVGTGFNVKMQGQALALKVGYSHTVLFEPQPGVTYSTDGNTTIIVSGSDKQLVGQIAYQIKRIKPPDVYKGKGIRFEGEKVRIKPGKKAKTA